MCVFQWHNHDSYVPKMMNVTYIAGQLLCLHLLWSHWLCFHRVSVLYSCPNKYRGSPKALLKAIMINLATIMPHIASDCICDWVTGHRRVLCKDLRQTRFCGVPFFGRFTCAIYAHTSLFSRTIGLYACQLQSVPTFVHGKIQYIRLCPFSPGPQTENYMTNLALTRHGLLSFDC